MKPWLQVRSTGLCRIPDEPSAQPEVGVARLDFTKIEGAIHEMLGEAIRTHGELLARPLSIHVRACVSVRVRMCVPRGIFVPAPLFFSAFPQS